MTLIIQKVSIVLHSFIPTWISIGLLLFDITSRDSLIQILHIYVFFVLWEHDIRSQSFFTHSDFIHKKLIDEDVKRIEFQSFFTHSSRLLSFIIVEVGKSFFTHSSRLQSVIIVEVGKSFFTHLIILPTFRIPHSEFRINYLQSIISHSSRLQSVIIVEVGKSIISHSKILSRLVGMTSYLLLILL